MPLEPSVLADLKQTIESIGELSVQDVHVRQVEDFSQDLERIKEAQRQDDIADLLIVTALKTWDRENEVLAQYIPSGTGTVFGRLLSFLHDKSSLRDREASRTPEEMTGGRNPPLSGNDSQYLGLSAPSPPLPIPLPESGSTLMPSNLSDNVDHVSDLPSQVAFGTVERSSRTPSLSTIADPDTVELQTNATGENSVLTASVVIGVLREVLLQR
jgi:hypothetical protein